MTLDEALRESLPCLRRTALKLTRNQADADDVIQDACLKAWRYWAAYTVERGAPKAWLLCILKREFFSSLRKREARPVTFNAEHCAAAVDAEVEWLLDGEALLSSLDGDQRAVMRLYVAGESHKEIAATLGIPIGTTLSRLHRARQRLSKELTL